MILVHLYLTFYLESQGYILFFMVDNVDIHAKDQLPNEILRDIVINII